MFLVHLLRYSEGYNLLGMVLCITIRLEILAGTYVLASANLASNFNSGLKKLYLLKKMHTKNIIVLINF